MDEEGRKQACTYYSLAGVSLLLSLVGGLTWDIRGADLSHMQQPEARKMACATEQGCCLMLPERALDAGYAFRFPDLAGAFADLFP